MNKNVKIYYISFFLRALVFSTPIWTFFLTLHLGFSMSWAIFIGTLGGFMNFLFEIPTGSWADRFGRKKLYITGLLIEIIGTSFYLWADNVYLFILSATITGFGSALMSGNIEAIIHDKLEETGEKEQYKEIQSHGYFFFFSGRALACLLWGLLFTLNPLLPYQLTIACMVLILPLLFLLDEPKQILSQENTDVSHIKTGLLYIKDRADLLYVIITLTIVSSIGNMYWFTYQPYLEKIGFTITSVGFSFALASVFSGVGSLFLKKLQHIKFEDLHILQYLIITLLISTIGFYFFLLHPSIFGILPIITLSILFGFLMSLGNSYIIGRVLKTHKSTSLSIFSFSITLGYFLFSSGMGLFIDQFSITGTYFWIFLLVLFLLPVNYFVFQKIKTQTI